jgi:hypothetical protein
VAASAVKQEMVKLDVTKHSTIVQSSTVIAANITTNRRTASVRKKHSTSRMRNDSSTATYGRMELDSHADTIVLGSNAIVLQYTSRECDVSPYSDSYEPIRNVPIVKGATAITSNTTGETLILVFNEAIWMGDHLDHSLLNPNQLRHYGIVVQDNPFDKTALHLASHHDEFIMPMAADGTTIYFDSRTPTDFELQNSPHIVLSSHAEWNPRDIQFPLQQHHAEEGTNDLTYN